MKRETSERLFWGAIRRRLGPSDEISSEQQNRGLAMLVYDGICSQTMSVLTGGAILVGFALQLGASNFAIGLIWALDPLTKLLQIPATAQIERVRQRRAIVVVSSTIGRFLWIPIALLPWLAPRSAQLPLLVLLLSLLFGFGTVSGLAWTSWMQDFIPREILGRYMASREAKAIAVGAVVSLASGYILDHGKTTFGEVTIYSVYMVLGGIFGLLGVSFVARTPEPRMAEAESSSLREMIKGPFRDAQFRPLLVFLGCWSFATNLATPFFTVFMLDRLKIGMTWIVGFSILSQVTNALTMGVWGKLADRYSNRSVLMDAGPIQVFTLLLWLGTASPEPHAMTLPLVALIHVLTGLSSAGVALATGNIALKLAPKSNSTGYLASTGLVAGIAAAAGPLLAGVGSEMMKGHTLTVDLRWLSDAKGALFEARAIHIRDLDFIFVAAFLFGVFALSRLLAVNEPGSVAKWVVAKGFRFEVQQGAGFVVNSIQDMGSRLKTRASTKADASEATIAPPDTEP